MLFADWESDKDIHCVVPAVHVATLEIFEEANAVSDGIRASEQWKTYGRRRQVVPRLGTWCRGERPALVCRPQLVELPSGNVAPAQKKQLRNG